MTHLSFDRWEKLVRASYAIVDLRRSEDAIEVVIRRSDGSTVGVAIDRGVLNSLEVNDSEIEDLLEDKLDTSLLRHKYSSKIELGIVEGWVGFYDPTHEYGVGEDKTPGAFHWVSSWPGDN